MRGRRREVGKKATLGWARSPVVQGRRRARLRRGRPERHLLAVDPRPRGRTLRFAALGNAIPVLGEHLAVNVLKELRHHARPQVGGVPVAVALAW